MQFISIIVNEYHLDLFGLAMRIGTFILGMEGSDATQGTCGASVDGFRFICWALVRDVLILTRYPCLDTQVIVLVDG